MTEFIITCDSELKPDGSYNVKRFRELVRCKDCTYGRKPILAYRKGCVWCKRIDRYNDADWFCADGKREAKLK